MNKIAILGCGNMGTALALVLAEHAVPVLLYSIEQDVTDAINRKHINEKYLAGIKLPRNISAADNIEDTVRDADMVIFAVPSFALEEVAKHAAHHLKKTALVGCITKGFDAKSGLPLGLEISRWLPLGFKENYCLIGGPAVATELALHKPSAIIIGSRDIKAAKKMAATFQGDTLKAATSEDITGIAYSMVLKNIYAIGMGLCEGLKFPMNTRALVMTVAIQEIGSILEAVGAQSQTAMSLAGLGDLIVTGFSPHGRNRTYGEKLVGSKSKDPKKLGLTTVEGIPASEIGQRLSKKLKVKAPLMDAIRACLLADKKFEQPFVNYLKVLRLK